MGRLAQSRQEICLLVRNILHAKQGSERLLLLLQLVYTVVASAVVMVVVVVVAVVAVCISWQLLTWLLRPTRVAAALTKWLRVGGDLITYYR